MSDALAPLRAVFDALHDEGRRIAFWWRDDDAIRETPALDRLLAITSGADIPLALAVIPAALEPSLPERLAGDRNVTILVHGWVHANHAPPAEKSAEFGPHREASRMIAEAREGRGRLEAAFGPSALPVFVPPWNRIAPEIARHLPEAGYRGLSCFGASDPHAEVLAKGEPRSTRDGRASFEAPLRGAPQDEDVERVTADGTFGVPIRIDTHLDPVAWRTTRSLAPIEQMEAALRRALDGGATEIGILTHHLVFDEPLWRFCEALAVLIHDHPAIEPEAIGSLLDGMRHDAGVLAARRGMAA